MKNYFLVGIICASFIFLPVPEALAFSGNGAGTEISPFEITTCSELQEMASDLDAYYKLMNDIDCTETAQWNVNLDEWEGGDTDNPLIPDSYSSTTGSSVVVVNNGYFGFSPVGDNNEPFTGVFDGNGKTISNIWIFRKDQDFVGLFGQTLNAHILDLTLASSSIVGRAYTGGIAGSSEDTRFENITLQNNMVRTYLAYYGGGLTGRSYGLLTSITGVNNVGGAVHGSGNIIGGIVGSAMLGEIRNSSSSADVDGGYIVGGAVGEANNFVIDNVHASGDVFSDHSEIVVMKTGYYSGGLVAYATGGTWISNSSASGNVITEGSYGGGFVGYLYESSIQNSSSTGNVVATEALVNGFPYEISSIGGFVGQIFRSTTTSSFTSSDVTAQADGVGGFAGQTYCESFLAGNYASGDVEGGDYVGGFVGTDQCMGPGSQFYEVFSTGDAVGNTYVGGFAGSLSMSTIVDAYATGDVSGNGYAGGFAGSSADSTITNVYSSGPVAPNGENFIAGFIGEAGSGNTITNSFWDTDRANPYSNACGDNPCIGASGKTTLEMNVQTTFTDAMWDFGDIWSINSSYNNGYPFFDWQLFNNQLPGSGTEEDPFQVTECFTVRQSGYYQLQNDISGAVGNCIIIEANDVHIDGDGRTMSGDEVDGYAGIYSDGGYDNLHISNLTLETFDDGIRIFDMQGTSTISSVTVQNVSDDAIELRGVTGFTIEDSTIAGVEDNGITVRSYYNESEELVNNNNIVVRNVEISGITDYGIQIEEATNVLVTDNNISVTDDDGITMYLVEDVQILNNILFNIGSDGIYTEGIINGVISQNTITGVRNADAIDVDFYNDEGSNTNVTISNNTISNIGDNGLEISDISDATVTDNTVAAYDSGIRLSNGVDMEFTGNTITPTISEFIQIPTVATDSLVLNVADADVTMSSSYNSLNYVLPFTFDFRGRDIVAIQASVSGAVELLEDGENCVICGDVGPYDQLLLNDVLFASFDGLTTESTPGDYMAIYSPNDEYVVIEWRGSTVVDGNSETHPLHFQLVLYPDGQVQWNFLEMNFELYNYSMFTGAYDFVDAEEYRAGLAISEPSSYRIDFSEGEEYETTEAYDPIVGVDMENVSDSSFIGNSFHADQWINAIDTENLTFNDSDSGNTYRLLNGAGAWTVFDIVDTNGNGYAESGTDRPFSQAVLGSAYWNGGGEDMYPGTETRRAVVENRTSRKKSSRRVRSSISDSRQETRVSEKDNDRSRDNEQNMDKKTTNEASSAVVSTTTDVRDLEMGMNGDDVKQLQNLLISLGFSIPAGPTGYFGGQTKAALSAYQAKNGIAPAIGYFGPRTRAQMKSVPVPGLWW